MNKVILIGNLSSEIKTRQAGDATVATFSVAVGRRFKKEGQPDADFVNIVCWRALAENCAKYLTKGKKVGIVGQLQTRNYDDKDGKRVFITEVVADEVEFLSPAEHREEVRICNAMEAPRQVKLSDLPAVEDDGNLPF